MNFRAVTLAACTRLISGEFIGWEWWGLPGQVVKHVFCTANFQMYPFYLQFMVLDDGNLVPLR